MSVAKTTAAHEIEPPRTIGELTERLQQLFAEVWNDQTKLSRAKELNNTAGKIIGAMKIVCVTAMLRDEMPAHPFLRGATAPKPLTALPPPDGK